MKPILNTILVPIFNIFCWFGTVFVKFFSDEVFFHIRLLKTRDSCIRGLFCANEPNEQVEWIEYMTVLVSLQGEVSVRIFDISDLKLQSDHLKLIFSWLIRLNLLNYINASKTQILHTFQKWNFL